MGNSSSRKIWRSRLLLFLLVLTAQTAHAQTRTAVTGVVKDPNGVPYGGAQLTGVLISPGGSSPSLTPCTSPAGCQIQQSVPPTTLGPDGSFSISLWANASILPAATTYSFHVSTTGVPLPFGTGPQSCDVPGVTIAGASQTITGSFTGVCPALTNSLGSGGNSAIKPAVSDGVFYVSTNGNDANDGLSWGTAKLTVVGANSAMPASGGTIYVGAGTFTGSFSLTKPIALRCNGPRSPTILTIANAANADVVTLASSHTSVKFCVIDGNRTNQTTGGAGVHINANLTDVGVSENTIQNTFAEGVATPGGGATFQAVTHNHFSNNNQSVTGTFALAYTEPSGGTGTSVDYSDNTFDESGPLTGCISISALTNNAVVGAFIVNNNKPCFVGQSAVYSTVGILLQGASGSPGSTLTEGSVSGNIVDGAPAINNGLAIGIEENGPNADTSIRGNSVNSVNTRCILVNNAGTSTDGENFDVTGNICDATGSLEITGTGPIAANVTGNTFGLDDPNQVILVDATSGTLTNVTVSSNTIHQVASPSFTTQKAIFFSSNVNNSTIFGNTITLAGGANQTQPAIQLTSSSNNLLAGNNISGYNGSGNGAIGILISNAGSISNRIGVNNFSSVTTPVSDSGTTTSYSLAVSFPFASLPAAANGSAVYCTDCNATCTAGSSTGRTCFRENGAWAH